MLSDNQNRKLINDYESLIKSERLAKVYYELFTKSDWIVRRVEAISIIDNENWNHKVSLDIDIDLLKTHFEGCISSSEAKKPIPIEIINKNLIVELDIMDCKSNPLSILPSRLASGVSLLVLYGYLCVQEGKNPKGKIKKSLLTEEIFSFVKTMMYCNENDLEFKRQAEVQASLDETSAANWKILNSDSELDELFVLFSRSYPLLVEIDFSNPEAFEIIKFRYIDASYTRNSSRFFLLRLIIWLFRAIAMHLGIQGKKMRFKQVRIGRAVREHIQIKAPPGMEICVKPFLKEIGKNKDTKDERGNRLTATTRTTPQQTVMCTRGDFSHFNKYDMYVQMRSCLTGFFRPTLACLLINAVIATAFIWMFANISFPNISIDILINDPMLPLREILADWTVLFKRVEVGDSGRAFVITLLLTIPSFYSAYLTRKENHRVRARMLRSVSYMAWFAVILTGLAAILFVAGIRDVFIALLTSIIASILGAIILIFRASRTTYLRWKITKNMSETTPVEVEAL